MNSGTHLKLSSSDVLNVLLLSGGVESSTLLHERANDGLHAVFIDYGQRAARAERAAAVAQCERAGVSLIDLDMAAVGRAFRAGQSRKWHVPLPHRNLVALSLGLSYASQVNARRLYLALNREDTGDYPSASLPFLDAFRQLARTLGKVELAMPFLDMSKAEIIDRGRSLRIDYEYSYSCLRGDMTHCGRCPQCQKRRAAFVEAGVSEPAWWYRGK